MAWSGGPNLARGKKTKAEESNREPRILWILVDFGGFLLFVILPPFRQDGSVLVKASTGGFHSHGGTPIAGWFTRENPI